MAVVRIEGRECSRCGVAGYEAYDTAKNICRKCFNKRANEYRRNKWEEYKESVNARNKRARLENPKWEWAKIVASSAKQRAKKSGVPYEIDARYLESIAVDVCPILGIVLNYNQKGPREDSPSVDRLVPHLGYVEGNLNVISNRANRLKSDGTVAELEAVLSWIKRLTNEATIS